MYVVHVRFCLCSSSSAVGETVLDSPFQLSQNCRSTQIEAENRPIYFKVRMMIKDACFGLTERGYFQFKLGDAQKPSCTGWLLHPDVLERYSPLIRLD